MANIQICNIINSHQPMFIDHNSYSLPPKIGPVKIKPLSWKDFKADPPQNSPYLAHIYWAVNYEFTTVSSGQPKVKVTVNVRPKSWKVRETFSLLKHQYGHYLIGCLCGLSFSKKINFELRWNKKINFGAWCNEVLGYCLRQYCRMQKLYDEQTNHNLNAEMQLYWQNKIKGLLGEFSNFYKNRKLELLVRDDRKTRDSHQKQGQKVENIQGFSKRFSLRKDIKTSNETRNTQFSPSKKRLKNQSQSQQKYMKNLQASTQSHIRYYKKLDLSDGAKNLQTANSFIIKPLPTGSKFF